MKKLLLAAIATILLSGAAQAAEVQCTPKDNTARILKSANPNDTAPGWKMAIVGTATSFTLKRTVNADTSKYFQGDLSDRGGIIGRNLFILAQDGPRTSRCRPACRRSPTAAGCWAGYPACAAVSMPALWRAHDSHRGVRARLPVLPSSFLPSSPLRRTSGGGWPEFLRRGDSGRRFSC